VRVIGSKLGDRMKICRVCYHPKSPINKYAATPWAGTDVSTPMCALGYHVFVDEDAFWAQIKADIAAIL
jgi:hypothetical protein